MQNDKEKYKKEFIKRLIKYSVNTIKFADILRKDKFYYSIIDQLTRCSTSVGANIVEAKASSSKKDYIKFFEISLKSANEVKYWLLIIKETNNNYDNKISKLLKEIEEISNIIASSIITLKGKNKF